MIESDLIQTNSNLEPILGSLTTNNSNNPGHFYPGDSQIHPNVYILFEPETRIYLYKLSGVYVGIFLFSLFLLLMFHSIISFQGTFGVIYSFLIYILLIEGFWTSSVLRELWVFDDYICAASSAISLLLVNLTLLHIIPLYVFACIPFILAALANYVFFRTSAENNRGLILLMCSLQTLLITLKVDNFIAWEWEHVFVVFWIYLGSKAYICLKYGFLLLKDAWSAFLSPSQENQNTKMHMIGCFWYCGLNSLSIIGIIALFGVIQADSSNSHNYDLLATTCYMSLFMSLTLLIYSCFSTKYIIEFIITFRLIESRLFLSQQNNSKQRNRIVTFQTEKEESYFVMLSSTYFQPLKKRVSNITKNISFQNVLHKARPGQIDNEYELMEIKNTENKGANLLAGEEDPCYICYLKTSNAVFGNCGHGGICCDCATKIVKGKGECMECRTKIDSIYKIESNHKTSNIVKGIELTKVVVITE